ncbi:MAG TPA: HYR domain-containing protein, partial [Candidatus Polarisedimenticolia bacterium]|nr:HYR domain-containing protein [Candidatus Polarisedimenticolia bacterium]
DAGWSDTLEVKTVDEDAMSAMGRLAADQADAREAAAAAGMTPVLEDDDGEPGVGDDDEGEGPGGGQAETSIAVDSTGMHIVIGTNDTRGFSLNPLSLSGYQYSDDGGVTWTDGGQLPITTGTSTIGTTVFPQVFGDPEVKYLGGCNFVYFSIVVKKLNATGTAQTMGMHRSTDCGHTWNGPYEVTSATNPHGLLTGAAQNARDSADKEFADVDPDTGRVMLSWSNFTATAFAAGGVEISTTFSDNVMSATPPTWSARSILGATAADGQASIPRFAGGGSNNVYVAWRRFPGGLNQNVGFARSLDNGATWSAATNTTTSFFTMDQVLGNDRINTSPSLAVDNSGGPHQGTMYLVYTNNNNADGGDVVLQKSTDSGLTFSVSILLSSRPGGDRPQWFPWVTVDKITGRVYVHYYDQGIATNGDLTQTTFLYSDDGGATWNKPMALSDRPYHAGWGNDTGQPNLGDYNQSVAQGGELFATWAGTELKGIADDQPLGNFSTPDVFFKRVSTPKISLDLGSVTFTDTNGNGFIDAGETVNLHMPLFNYVTNPLHAAGITGISATLSTSTAGVTVTTSGSSYPNIAAGATGTNDTDFVLQLDPSFVRGTHIELALNVACDQGTTRLLFTQSTGTPETTTLLSENFNGAAPGTLPAGWVAAHGAGDNTIPWTTNSTLFGTTSNAAFHQNAADGPAGGQMTRWERLISPVFSVPAGAEYMTVDMDVAYDTEDDPAFNVQAFDGFFLRITDNTTGRVLISALAEAFEEELTTDGFQHYPKHFPRNSNARYFEDMSVWAGFSNGFKHVHMKFPGAGGLAGGRAQLRFEYAQDSSATCATVRPGHTCGVMVDNVLVQSVVSAQADLVLTKTAAAPSVTAGDTATYNLTVTNNGPSTASGVVVTDNLPAEMTFASCSSTGGGICGGSGNNRTVTLASLASGASATITLTGTLGCAVPDGTTVVNSASVSAGTPDNGAGNNSSSASFNAVNPPPLISCPSDINTVNDPGLCSAVVTYPDPTATDDCGGATVTTDVASGSAFPVGETTVTATAVDVAGGTSTCSFKVTVADNELPVVAVSLTPDLLWPPNHQTVSVGATVTATDNCGPPTCVLSSVTSSEADNASGNGDGNTVDDIQNAATSTPDLSFDLRAERSASGQGRVYTASYTCSDASANATTQGSAVFVPHDQSGVEDPVHLDVTAAAQDAMLTWNAIAGADYYSVIRGNRASLAEEQYFINLGEVACLETQTQQTSRVDNDTPAVGEVFFYVVAYHHGTDSTYGAPTASKPRVPGNSCP